MPRIEPLEPPYSDPVDRALRRWMPPGVAHEPIALFRVLHRHPELASRMFAVGSGLLGHGLLSDADRETVIARVTARAGCAYEWGVHAAVFAEPAGLTPEHMRATADDDPTANAAWTPRQAALLRAVDELHDSARLSTGAWGAVRDHYGDAQILEFLVLTGWYRTIGYLANALLLDDEPWAAPFPGDPGVPVTACGTAGHCGFMPTVNEHENGWRWGEVRADGSDGAFDGPTTRRPRLEMDRGATLEETAELVTGTDGRGFAVQANDPQADQGKEPLDRIDCQRS